MKALIIDLDDRPGALAEIGALPRQMADACVNKRPSDPIEMRGDGRLANNGREAMSGRIPQSAITGI